MSIDTLLDEVRTCSKRVLDLTDDLDKRRLAGMSNCMERVHQGVKTLQGFFHDSRRRIANIQDQSSDISDRLLNVCGDVQVMGKLLQDGSQEMGANLKKALLDQQQVMERQWEAALIRQRKEHEDSMTKVLADTRREITAGMVILCMEHCKKIDSMLLNCIDRAYHISRPNKAQAPKAEKLINHNCFRGIKVSCQPHP